MNYFFQDFKNNIDFFIRKYLNFSRKNYFIKNESKENLFNSEILKIKESFLMKKYQLDFLKNNSSTQNYLENLYLIDILDKYLEIKPQETLNILDIGCKNWFYAKGEYFFFKKFSENLFLKGIELDSNRLYTNFYTRKEVAKYHIQNLKGVDYIEGDFLEQNNQFNYIIWILPFVVKTPLIKWGLPEKYFQPEKMLKHAFKSLSPNGKLFIINQGFAEYEEQIKFCEKLNLKYKKIGEINSDFLKYKNKRYSVLIEKI
jgi:hypothetical protein